MPTYKPPRFTPGQATPAPAPQPKRPAAPPVYRPQPAPRVLQRKAAAPAHGPQTLQTKTPPARQAGRTPAGPPAYRPQPPPKVLQKKPAVATPQPRPSAGGPAKPTSAAPTTTPAVPPTPPAVAAWQRPRPPAAAAVNRPAAPPAAAVPKGMIQRKITPDMAAIKLLGRFKTSYPEDYKEATVNLHISDDELAGIYERLRGYQASTYYIDDAHQVVRGHIREWADTAPLEKRRGGVGDRVEITLSQVEAKFPPGLDVSTANNVIKVYAREVSFKAKATVKIKDGGKWEVGFTQTLLNAHRELKYLTKAGKKGIITISRERPIRDGAPNARAPWPHNLASHTFTREEEHAEISYEDRPGFSVDLNEGEQLQSVSGTDNFKTWIILTNGVETQFLRMWAWSIYYTADKDKTARCGAHDDGYALQGHSLGAVLGGPTIKDHGQLTTTDRVLP